MNTESIIYGNSILPVVPQYERSAPLFMLNGVDGAGRPAAWNITSSLLSRHLLLLGAIGTGKSNTMYHLLRGIRTTMTERDTLFIFDTKGDFYRRFYMPGDIVIANDSRATGGWWNLFREVTVDDRQVENASEIADAVFAEQLEKTSQPFFPNAARDLLKAVILNMCRDRKLFPQGGDNETLLHALQTVTPERLKGMLSRHRDLQGMIPYIADPKSGQTLGVISELQQGVNKLLVGNFAKKGGLSMRELVRRKGRQTVFIEYDLSIGSVLTPVYRLLIDLAIKEALSRSENEGNVYFMIDEFRLLPKLTHIDDGVNFGRSLGAKFIIGIQNVQQVFHAYSEDLARSLLSGFSTAISFRLNDSESRIFIEDLSGKNGRVTSYSSSVSSRGLQEQYRETTVIEDHDLNRLDIGQALIQCNGVPPFVFRFEEYR